MLQIHNIRKEYRTGDLVQKALDGVSLSFRDNEFVAILGPSGSGKTTLLNIIGGLDQYDSGDLIINGISTKQYKDRDWDSYRNHTIGFVFQSYNLIPHQTVLENVELALTISGISKTERRQKAVEALEKVGLGDQLHKRPSQMSGGQMQRVAIARALVNDSDILLADEPTGALDSDTSLQVMELLKEVANDRLVIMVTHNSELAETYATRIVNLKDGQIVADSDPFEPEEIEEEPLSGVNLGYSTMSFFTALQLSFRNLLTKKARTILVALAGSIGIIGIALILSTSNGVNQYIEDIEEDTLSEYPLEITGNSFSIFSMLEELSGVGGSGTSASGETDSAVVLKTVTALLSQMSANDLGSLKEYLESGQSGIEPYTRSVRYIYNITPLIFQEKGDKFRQVSPYKLFSSFDSGMTLIGSSASTYSTSATDFFHEMPGDENLYKGQYEVKAGRWPEKYNECVIVLNSTNSISDFTMLVLGLADDAGMEKAVENYLSTGKVSADDAVDMPDSVKYEDFVGIKFRLVNPSDCYSYDPQYQIWSSRMNDEEYMNKLVGDSEEMSIVGVVKSDAESTGAMLHAGINYTSDLTKHIIKTSENSEIVQAQLKTPGIDVLTGRPFDEKEKKLPDLFSLFSIDSEAMMKAFSLNEGSVDSSQFAQVLSDALASSFSADSLNIQDYLQPGMIPLDQIPEIRNLLSEEALRNAVAQITSQDFSQLLEKVTINISQEELEKTANILAEGFDEYGKTHPEADIRIYQNAINDFLASDEARAIIIDGLQEMIRNSSDSVTREDIKRISDDISAGYKSWAEANNKTETEKYPEYLAEYLQSDELLTLLQNDVTELMVRAAGNLSQEELNGIADKLYAAFQQYLADNHLPTLESISAGFLQYLQSDEAKKILNENIVSKIDTQQLQTEITNQITNYLKNYVLNDAVLQSVATAIMNNFLGSISQAVSSQLENAMSGAGEQIIAALGSMISPDQMFSVDTEALKNAVTLNVDASELRSMLSSFLSDDQSTYEKNLKNFGYADLDSPAEIMIYPKDFESKNMLTDILQEYNQRMLDSGQEEKVISFSDMMSTMMSSVTTIINAVSYVLIAFVAISLVVSSIMIGVITYISVFERRKEIGILRAIGASKRNIANVFNAETIITGLLAGLFGVGLTYLLLIPVNIILHSLTGQDIRAFLPIGSAAILILLSIVLTLIGGLIPSSKAANSDPVTALRNE